MLDGLASDSLSLAFHNFLSKIKIVNMIDTFLEKDKKDLLFVNKRQKDSLKSDSQWIFYLRLS